MGDGEFVCVEHESTRLDFLACSFGVDGVGDDGGADMNHMDSDLVGAAGV